MKTVADAPRLTREEIWKQLIHREPCPVCDDVQWLEVDEEAATECPCRGLRARLRQHRELVTELGTLNLGNGDLNRKPFIDLDRQVQAVVRGFVKDLSDHIAAGRGLWLEGPNGTSKTSTARAIGKRAWHQGHVVAFQTAPHILHLMRRTFEGERPTSDYLRLLRRVVTVDLLVLDDLGKEHLTGWVQEKFYEIVNGSVQEIAIERKPRALIVTTELTATELAERCGSAVVSRLHELCGKPIVFGGEDWRKKLAIDWSERYPAEAA